MNIMFPKLVVLHSARIAVVLMMWILDLLAKQWVGSVFLVEYDVDFYLTPCGRILLFCSFLRLNSFTLKRM